MEIERKFLVRKLPDDLERYASSRITQAYLSRRPTIRIRKKDEQYILTVKGPGKLAHEEFELSIEKAAYERLLKKCDGKVIEKRRYRIPYGKYTIELDLFTAPKELVLAEVEFESVEEALSFEGPEWFSEDVTEDPRYSNAQMAYEE